MGAFLVNFHVRADSTGRVSDTLRQIPLDHAWIAGPHGDWVSFWDEEASRQNTDRIEYLAEHVSRSLETLVIAFLVHDSDVLCYCLYDSGTQLDHYNSCPGYWGDATVDEKSLAADCQVLASYCRPGTEPSQLEKLLTQRSRADMAAGAIPPFIFAEEPLAQLAPLLGLREDVVMTDYVDIGREVRPEELGAVWIGSARPPDRDSRTDDAEPALRAFLPPAPLHEAAARDDIAAIERLIAEGADINDIPHGYTVTALAMAASEGTAPTIRKLVALGADLHKKGPQGATPLRFAIQSFRVENIRTLVELGADLDEYDTELGTLLHLAVTQASPDVVRLLLDLGLDPERPNTIGITPLFAVHVQLRGLRQAQSMLGGSAQPAVADEIRKLEELERIMTRRSE